MDTSSLASKRLDVSGLDEATELFYEKGWTDGLPVVPPTEERVLQFLEFAGKAPSDVLGTVPVRGRVVTAEKVAVSAAMAGCKPEYMPVVLAAVEGMLQEQFNVHGTSASTGGSAVMLVVNGPARQALGLNSGGNLFGPGPTFRANATIGRAIRLFLINVLGNVPGVLDRSTFGHGGKYSMCIAEDEEHSPWEPFHVERGFRPDQSTVTVMTVQAPWQSPTRRGETPEAVLAAIADTIKGVGPNNRELTVIIGGELMGPIREAEWTKQQVKEFLAEHSRRTAQDWASVYKAEEPPPEKAQELVPVLSNPEEVIVLAAGGLAGSQAAVVPHWGGGINTRSVTREVDTSRLL
ncbi:MAG: hypothetical protein ACE5IG_01725 [Dehalococcoidia bacterium]